MSEFQFYEFQAIDRPLSATDKQHVQSLSSRVKLTGTNAQFVYHYGDFRGDPEKLLDRCFDLMVYVANFGIRQLMIRFPKNLVDRSIFDPYCVEDCIEVKVTTKSIILNIGIHQENYYGWLEETSYAADLLALREDLIQGDLRVLYLAWLAAGFGEDIPEDPEDLIEPPVPANLKKLSPALKAFAALFEIDADLIGAAAQASKAGTAPTEPIAEWVAALPEADRNAYLVRAAAGEPIGGELLLDLRQRFGQSATVSSTSPGRSLAELVELATSTQKTREAKARKAAAAARQKYLQEIAPQADQLWQQAMQLIELKQSKPYDEAVAHLVDLRDVAAMQGKLDAFLKRIQDLHAKYPTRSGLLNRLREANLLK
ncbi:hypothetical protein ACN4EG_23865 [Alkalinema pantanalense CENA528]|uniref:hypothetical protein n=1 Tax=Alkalinema pantanalense TaxID=1620705 RepID=UPI003D700147